MEKERDPYIPQEEVEEKEEQQGIVSRIFQGLVVLLVLAGLIYSSGVYQYFFFRRTPASVEQERTKAAIDAERIAVQLTIFIVANDETNGSRRSTEDAVRLVENADRIWDQASIDLVIHEMFIIERDDEEIEILFSDARLFVQNVEEFETRTINAFLVGNLQGLNGVAFGGIPAIAVADYTTVYDFRAFAHEVGHKLGLGHVPVDKGRLMYRGANGFELSLQEIMRARGFAERFQ